MAPETRAGRGARALTRAVLAVLFALAGLSAAPTPSYACADARLLDGDVGAATVIVEGWVESATPRPDLFSGLTGSKAATLDLFIPVELAVRVARPVKGTMTDPFVFFARADRPLDGSVPRTADGSIRFAGGPACAWPATDPIGSYALLLLTGGYANRLVPLRSSGTFEGPDDPALVARRQEVMARLPVETVARTLPAPLRPDTRPDWWTSAAVAMPLLLLAAGALALVAGGPSVVRATPRTGPDDASSPERELAPA